MKCKDFIFIWNCSRLLLLIVSLIFLRQKWLVLRLLNAAPAKIEMGVVAVGNCIVKIFRVNASREIRSGFRASIMRFRKKLAYLRGFLLEPISDQLLHYLQLINSLSLYSELLLFLTYSLQILSLVDNRLLETTLCS